MRLTAGEVYRDYDRHKQTAIKELETEYRLIERELDEVEPLLRKKQSGWLSRHAYS